MPVHTTSYFPICHCNCHESGCHSLLLHITHRLHLPSCTALTHSHPPLHHVTIHSLALIVSPHLHLIHTHTFKQHSHMHSPRSLVLAPADISERFPCILLPCVWPRTAWLWNSEPVLVTSTPAWYCLRLCSASDIPVVVRWPLPVWFCLCLINLTASGSTRLRPVITATALHIPLWLQQL